MKKIVLCNVLIACLMVSCHKDDQHSNPNAEIIKFNPEKCRCCWGWSIKIGKDTIKTDDRRFSGLFGYEITKPLPVYVDLGERDQTCPSYFKIIKIEPGK